MKSKKCNKSTVKKKMKIIIRANILITLNCVGLYGNLKSNHSVVLSSNTG